MKNSDQNDSKKVPFSFETDPGKNVFVAGSFNGWQPSKMKPKGKNSGAYSVALKLPTGRHEYKFVVGDCWCADPKNPETVPNDCGSTNSVLVVE